MRLKTKKILNRLTTILCIIFACISVVFLLLFIVTTLPSFFKKKDFVYKECNETYPYNKTSITYSKGAAREKINQLFGNPIHIYSEKQLAKERGGQTILIFNWITMNSENSVEQYIFNYAHELVHLTERVANERYTNYKAFIKLYESGDEQFKAVAERYLYWDLQGCSANDYTCGYYIMQYLNSI